MMIVLLAFSCILGASATGCEPGFIKKVGHPFSGLSCSHDSLTCHENPNLSPAQCAALCTGDCILYTQSFDHGWCHTMSAVGSDAPSTNGFYCEKERTECPETQPEFGSPCSAVNTIDCSYGEECCCGECHSSVQMTCLIPNGEDAGVWSGFFTDACLASFLNGCPGECPKTQPEIGSPCLGEGEATCFYGEECCCGECHSTVKMECATFDGFRGVWQGVFLDSCLGGCPDDVIDIKVANECPATQPQFFSPCPDAGELQCSYGEQCCCGDCFPTTRMSCIPGFLWTGVSVLNSCLCPLPVAKMYRISENKFVTWLACDQSELACDDGVDFDTCASFGVDNCNERPDCLGFAVRQVPGFKDDIVLYTGDSNSCILENMYDDRHWTFYLVYDEVPEPECPAAEPELGSPCPESGALECSYGEECCCGECFPSFRMSCEPGAIWSQMFTEACFVATVDGCNDPEPECPETQPEFGSPCFQVATCSYGEECCCGECSSSVTMTCSFLDGAGKWIGRFTDACLFASRNGCIGAAQAIQIALIGGAALSSSPKELVDLDGTEALGEIQCCTQDDDCTRHSPSDSRRKKDCISGHRDASKFTFKQAADACKKLGEEWGLCSRDQVNRNLCQGKGCGHDSQLVWAFDELTGVRGRLLTLSDN